MATDDTEMSHESRNSFYHPRRIIHLHYQPRYGRGISEIQVKADLVKERLAELS